MSELQINLTVRSKVTTPEYISELLQVSPSYSVKKGERRREGQTAFLENVWSYKIPIESSVSSECAQDEIVRIFSLNKNKLKMLSNSCDIECMIYLCHKSEAISLGFSPIFLGFLSDIHARLEFEVSN